MAGVTIRTGGEEDLDAVARIQAASPQASQWNAACYPGYDFAVAVAGGRVAGFVVSRRVAEDEIEILNLAVDAAFRRQGIGRRLVDKIRLQRGTTTFLEVRESNSEARAFYERLGFQVVTLRPAYYTNSYEGAIVMKFHSC